MSKQPTTSRKSRSFNLWFVRRYANNPLTRYQAAGKLQEHYQDLADQAARVQMEATAQLAAQMCSTQAAAEMVGRPAAWVIQAIRVTQGMEESGGPDE